MKFGAITIRTILDQMRHDGCGVRAGKAELLTGIKKQGPEPEQPNRLALWQSVHPSCRSGSASTSFLVVISKTRMAGLRPP